MGPLKYPFRIVISDRPHLVYEASLQDLLEPTKEVVIGFIYRAEDTTSKSPGNTTTTTRMTVTIKDIMPQGIETMAEGEVGNNIVNNGNVGIEMGDVAGEAGGMAVQSSNRRRREKERKRKYRARKSGPVDVSA